MALNMTGRGLGFEIGAKDTATPVLNNLLGTMAAAPSRMAPMLGMLGRLGGGATSFAGSAGQAASAVGGFGAALGPIAIAIGVLITAFITFKTVAAEAEAIISSSIDTFATYETGLAEVGTILGGTVDQMDAVGESARRMSATFGVDVQTQLKATYQAMSAGFADAAEGAAVMTTANKLAVAGVTDVFKSVDLLTTVLNGYGIAAENSMEASDALFTAVRFGKTTVDALSAAMGMVTPSAVAAGLSLDETMAAMSTLTLAGQSTRMSSVALGRAMDWLSKMPPKTKAALDDLGISSDELNVRTHGLQHVLGVLGGVLEKDEKALFGMGAPIRAFRALMPLATTMSEKFGEAMEAQANKIGTTDEALERMTGTIDFQRRRWAAFKETLMIEFGKVFAPIMKTVLSVLEAVIDAVMALPAPLRRALLSFAAVGLSLPVIADKGLGLVWTVVKLGVVALVAASAFAVFWPILLVVAAAMAPLVAIAGTLVLAWKTDFLGLKTTVTQVWDKIMLTFETVSALIKGGGILSGPLAEELGKVQNVGVLRYANMIAAVFHRLKVFGIAMWEGIVEGATEASRVLERIFPEIKGIAEALFGATDASVSLEKELPVERFKEIGKAVGDALGAILFYGAKTVEWIKEDLLPVLSTVWSVIKIVGQVGVAAFTAIKWALSPLINAVLLLVVLLERVKILADDLGISGALAQLLVPPPAAGGPAAGIGAPLGVPAPVAPAAPSPMMGLAFAAPVTAPVAGLISLAIKSVLEVDGDALGEKVNKYQVDLAGNENIAEPA